MPQELEGGGYYAYLPFIPVYATVFTYERRQHGAEPGHGAGEGEGHRPHHRGEQFRGVQVHDTPAHLRTVFRQGFILYTLMPPYFCNSQSPVHIREKKRKIERITKF